MKGSIIHSYKGYEVNPDADVYSRKGQYDCTASVYATYTTSAGAIQDLIVSEGCVLRETKGSLKVRKIPADTSFSYLENCPGTYTLAGAVYGIYSNYTCTNLVARVTTGSDGYSNAVSLDQGTYYVKEIS
ncbi:MAG: hypothetical protein IKX97_00815, partial [Erysipelotrichaceae bacterium]|nr:hypothetical protein [Erysipelotrichaceae bacterium]